MQATFFWHDYETFGAIPRSDRPAQFAGIRTDLALNEIDDPVMIYCQPSLDALPSPQACLMTGLTPQYCQENGLIECEFATLIEKELAKANTIGVGFNSIRFDDEVTRFLFWRNLIDPYSREWRNGCGRWDLMDVTRALYALKPKAISWPINEEGKVHFKLEALSKANGLLHEAAHDALSDSRATLDLARLIRKVEPAFFEFCLKLRHKEQVRAQLSLDDKRPILHVSGMYGVERAFLAVVWPLAPHPTNKNEVIVWDLQADPTLLTKLSVEEIKARLFTATEQLTPHLSRLPIKTISLNKSPFVVNDLRVLTAERAAQLSLDLKEIYRHAELAKALCLAPTLWSEVYQREAKLAVDVDEDLYGGFVPDSDRYLLEKLRKLKGSDLAKSELDFQDARLNELLFRYRARNFPAALSTAEAKRWEAFCREKNKAKGEDFWQNFNELYAQANQLQISILDELKNWVGLKCLPLSSHPSSK